MCRLPRGDLLECIWGFEFYRVHALPRRDLLSEAGDGFRVHVLPGWRRLHCGGGRGGVCVWKLERGG